MKSAEPARRRRRAVGALLVLLALWLAACSPARSKDSEVPPAPTRYVTDGAGVLEDKGDALNARLEAFEKETSNQVVVWIAPRVPDGWDLESFATAAFEKWGVGRRDKDNGVLFLVFPQDRKTRIEVGYGLEGALTDALSSRIIQEQAIPNFRTGNYGAGVTAATEGILAATKGEYQGTGRTNAGDGGGGESTEPTSPWDVVIGLGIIVAFFGIFFLVIRFIGRRFERTFGPAGRHPVPWFWTSGGSGGSGWGSGGGGWGGGGGFSGGGGSSGGGGASGGW